MQQSLVIDLVPYEVESTGNHLGIKECGGSVLASLDNDPAVTGNRFSDELNRVVLETDQGELRGCSVEYHQEDGGTVYFSSTDGDPVTLDEVERWVGANYDRMQSIGYETLMSDEELDTVISRHRSTMNLG